MSIDRGMDKEDVVHTHTHIHTHTHTLTRSHAMDYYSDTKKNKVIPFAVTWLGSEIIRLSEVR